MCLTVLVAFFCIFLQGCWATEAHSIGVTETAEEILCLLYIEGKASPGGLGRALEFLDEVEDQIHLMRLQFAEQSSILEAIETLLVLKTNQIAHDGNSIEKLTRHLEQVNEALSIALDYGEAGSARDDRYSDQNVQSAAITKNHRADKIRLLKTGAFIMVMLSTTADVCVVTGPVVCFALFVAGSGAVVVWFAQIYQAMFGDGKIGPN